MSTDWARSSSGGPLAAKWTAARLEVHSTAWVSSHLPIAWPTWPKGLWPKVVALTQKIVRRLLRWYIDPIVEQQNQFNSAVIKSLDETWSAISHIERQLSELEAQRDEQDDRKR